MRLNRLLSFAALVASTLQVEAAVTANEIVTDLGDITRTASKTTDITKRLTPLDRTNSVKLIPIINGNLQEIVNGVNDEIFDVSMGGFKEAFAKNEQARLCNAFGNLTDVHLTLLQNLVDKSIFFVKLPSATGITGSLGKLLGMFKTLADGFIKVAPTCTPDVEADLKLLQNSIRVVLGTFS